MMNTGDKSLSWISLSLSHIYIYLYTYNPPDTREADRGLRLVIRQDLTDWLQAAVKRPLLLIHSGGWFTVEKQHSLYTA